MLCTEKRLCTNPVKFLLSMLSALLSNSFEPRPNRCLFLTVSYRRQSPPFLLASGGFSFDHRFLPKIDARAWKTSLTRVTLNDKPKNWGYGDFKGWTRFVQSLFFPSMKERDKRGSARRVHLRRRGAVLLNIDRQKKLLYTIKLGVLAEQYWF